MNIVEFQEVSKVYSAGDHILKALDEVNLTLEKGKFWDQVELVSQLY